MEVCTICILPISRRKYLQNFFQATKGAEQTLLNYSSLPLFLLYLQYLSHHVFGEKRHSSLPPHLTDSPPFCLGFHPYPIPTLFLKPPLGTYLTPTQSDAAPVTNQTGKRKGGTTVKNDGQKVPSFRPPSPFLEMRARGGGGHTKSSHLPRR